MANVYHLKFVLGQFCRSLSRSDREGLKPEGDDYVEGLNKGIALGFKTSLFTGDEISRSTYQIMDKLWRMA